jgi:hypothetical protein
MKRGGVWNAGRPGRPEGGDAQGMRALFELIKEIGEKGGLPVQDEEAADASSGNNNGE